LLASADKIWEVSTGRQVRSLVQRSYGGVAFSPDGRWMISEGSEGIPVLREVATGKETYPLAGHKASIQNVAVTFHPGGKIAATGGWDNTVRFWDVETGRELGVVPVPHIWEVSRAELETCVSKPATNSSEPARVRCTVWATLRNASGLKAWLPSKHYMIYLYEGPKKKSSLSDLTWNGQRESIDAEYSMERYRYAALEPGESGEFTLSFDLPENIDRRKLSLVVLDGPPAEVAEASGSRPVSTSAAVASRPSSSSGSKDSFSFTTDRTGKLVAVNNEPVGSGAGAAPAKNSREWEDLARRVVQLHEQAKFSEALPVAERALKVAEQTFGPEDTKVATSLNSLASIYDSLKKFDAALPLAKRAVALQEKLLGPEHADVGNALNTLGMIYSGQEKFVEAEETFEHAIAITEKAKGPKDEQLGLIYNNLGKAYSEQDKYSEAEAAYERSLDILEEKVGPWDQRLAAALNNLAYVRKQKRDYDGALMLYERSLGVLERGVGENHPYVAVVLENLAALYKLKGWTKEAQEASARAQRIKSNR
ncbi:MAG: WD40 repeat domain-containing protein, partial [Terriglobales bacterium]